MSAEAGAALVTYIETEAAANRQVTMTVTTSTESEVRESENVIAQTTTGRTDRVVVSGEGGSQPVWRRDGKSLYFVDLQGQLRRVVVRWSEDGEPSFGLPIKLDLPRVGSGHWGTQYDISPDGKRLYFMEPNQEPAPQAIHIAINWRALLD